MYLLFISFSFSAAYFVLLFAYPYFFTLPAPKVARPHFWSAFGLILASLVAQQLSQLIPDPFWSGRVLHFLGGGVVAFLAHFLALRDSGVNLSRGRFFILGYLIVTTLGVFNEHMELLLQVLFNTSFSLTPFDTWLDLLSNTLGACTGGFLLSFFLPRSSLQKSVAPLERKVQDGMLVNER